MARALVLLAGIGCLLLVFALLAGGSPDVRSAPDPVSLVEEEPATPETELARTSEATFARAPRDEVSGACPAGALVTVFGSVADVSGRTIESFRVIALNDAGDVFAAKPGLGPGSYELDELPPGRWRVHALAEGYEDIETHVALEPSPARHRVDLLFERAVIDVRIETPEGRRLSDAIRENLAGVPLSIGVRIGREHPGDEVAPTDSSDTVPLGKFLPRKDGKELAGTVYLAGLPPVYVSAILGTAVLASEEVPEPVREVLLVVPLDRVRAQLASICIHVVDAESGRAIAGAAVLVHAPGSPIAKDFTGREGTVAIQQLVAGEWTVHVRASGFEDLRRTMTLMPGEDSDLGTLALSAMASIAGRTVDLEGRPVPSKLQCLQQELLTDRNASSLGDWQSTRADGTFRLENVGRSRHVLLATAAGYARGSKIVDTSGGSLEGEVIVLERGVSVTIDHRIEDPFRYRLRVVDGAGVPVQSTIVRGYDWPWTFLAAPGRYSVQLLDRDELMRSLPLDVATEPVSLEITP